MRYFFLRLIPLLAVLASCKGTRQIASGTDDNQLEFVLVQVNDVYEIGPVSGGKEGGVARIAALKKQHQASNPNTFLLMAGDFLSPSVFNSLTFEGKRIRGRQMVDAMNAADFDFAVFGNHEFDINEKELQERLNESSFQWISSNSFLKRNDSIMPFTIYDSSGGRPLPATYIFRITDADGTAATIGLMGINITSNAAGYVEYTDPLATAKKLFQQMSDSCDAVIAITHQSMEDDRALATAVPGIPLIAGGHEHDMRFDKQQNTYITKAHANARSAYVIKVRIDKKARTVAVLPELRYLDSTVTPDKRTDSVVSKWLAIADQNYAAIGFDPRNVIMNAGDSLEGREVFTRAQATNFTDIVVRSMQAACPEAQFVIMNAGAIRLDDVLYPPVSQFDILRSLPFGGGIREVDMKGALLQEILAAGLRNKGTGGYLHHNAVPANLESERVYRVALADFLLTGGETNLGFLKPDNPGITKVYPEIKDIDDARSDIRQAIIQYLRK